MRLATLAVECLGDQRILIFDERRPEEGRPVAGVARRYTGTAGRRTRRVTTWAAWSTKRGYALIDDEVFLPGEWFAEGGAARFS